ncbi:putative receptor-like protein kinase At3g47110, partial [Triticum dicoccoides]|uniref:putative receptor-like protein kinase At3g47110 n=1 Tax=Triticum dicoccoides TaxID=85692 RepID=UPI00188FA0A3
SIPVDIGNLAGLGTLSIANNSMYGVIPESICKLQNLIELYLYNNSLSGFIPQSLGNLSELNKLVARNCALEGPIPASQGELKNLIVLELSKNYHLNGSMPKEIFKLPSLSWYLDLSYNSLSGPIPNEVGSLTNLNPLTPSGNRLSGKIPESIQNCKVLEWLSLDSNLFEGSIPQSIKIINGLHQLNLTMNKWSGNIPDAIGNIGNLQELYLAKNNLSGSIPLVLRGEVPKEGVFRNITYSAVAGNVNLCGGTPQLHLHPCPTSHLTKNKRKMPKYLLISLATVETILFSLLVILLIWILKKIKPGQKILPQNSFVDNHYKRIPYHALLRGINEFSEVNLLGRGSYGVVYKCVLDTEERTLAVKVFNLAQSRHFKSLEGECEVMRMIRHCCLIKI